MDVVMKLLIKKLLALIGVISITCCSTSIPIKERENVRKEVDLVTIDTLDKLVLAKPEVQEQLDQSAGHFVVNVSNIKVPFLGAGTGLGSLYDKKDNTITYMNVEHYDLGLGLGATEYKLLAIFDEQQALTDFSNASWTPTINNEWRIGPSGTIYEGKFVINDQPVSTYLINETGSHISSNARLVNISVNEELTDTGISEVNVPMREGKEERYRDWNRALPFYGQQVIDKGYDLPLPWGVSLFYSDTFQGMDISDLEVSLQDDKPLRPIEFASLNDNSSSSQSPQVKVDVWVLPFLNVFAALGHVSGTAQVHVALNGDDLIDQSGANCDKPMPDALCRFAGQEAELPRFDVTFDGVSYTGGVVLAGGWNSYFVAMPISYTYADMSSTKSEGSIFSTSPRAGKIFQLAGSKSLALYGGASYLDSELIITGSYNYKIAEEDFRLEYKVKQENSNKWAGLVGANITFNRYWSWAFEYVGFTDDREQFITNLNRRF
jgi:hypothetical protein